MKVLISFIRLIDSWLSCMGQRIEQSQEILLLCKKTNLLVLFPGNTINNINSNELKIFFY